MPRMLLWRKECPLVLIHMAIATWWYLLHWSEANPLLRSLFLTSASQDEKAKDISAGFPHVSLGPLSYLSSQLSPTTWPDSSYLISDTSFSSSTMNLLSSDSQVCLTPVVGFLQYRQIINIQHVYRASGDQFIPWGWILTEFSFTVPLARSVTLHHPTRSSNK